MRFPPNDFPEAFLVLDDQNTVVGINPAGEKLLKKRRTDLIGKSVGEVFSSRSISLVGDDKSGDGRKGTNSYPANERQFCAEL